MKIKEIDIQELRKMDGKEGLILQGCSGKPKEWVDGINQLLKDEKILLEGSKFQDCYVFQNGDKTCLLFPFGDLKLDVGKFAIWRLKTHAVFGGTWLSDYVDNYLGGFINQKQRMKPDCPLIGEDGNIFNLMAIASRTLRQNDMQEQAEEMYDRIGQSGSYGEALNIIGEYVNITSVDDEIEEEEEGVMMQQ